MTELEKKYRAIFLRVYAKGMTVRDIQEHVSELYGTEISRDLISSLTDAVLEDVTEWRNRPLESVYPIVYIDGFVANVGWMALLVIAVYTSYTALIWMGLKRY